MGIENAAKPDSKPPFPANPVTSSAQKQAHNQCAIGCSRTTKNQRLKISDIESHPVSADSNHRCTKCQFADSHRDASDREFFDLLGVGAGDGRTLSGVNDMSRKLPVIMMMAASLFSLLPIRCLRVSFAFDRLMRHLSLAG
jgi:hypothetical protein